MATHSSTLAWKISWTEEPAGGRGATVHGVAELDMTKHLWLSPLGRQMLLPLEGRGSNAAKDHVRPRRAPPDPQKEELSSSTSDGVMVQNPV